MKFSVIVNTQSGSVPADGAGQIADELKNLGHDFEIHSVEGADLGDVWSAQDFTGLDGIIAWGGDGTLSFILAKASERSIPVLPLPGGTMNLLPKQIHGNACEWKTCLRDALSSRRSQSVPGMRIGETMCYVGILIGRLTRLARSREHLRSGELGSAVETLVGQDVLNLKTRLEVQDEDDVWDATALGVFVPEDGSGPMDIASIDPDNLAELVEMGLESLMGQWRTASGVLQKTARSIEIGVKDAGKVSVTLDGEPGELETPFTIEFHEKAAEVWSARPE